MPNQTLTFMRAARYRRMAPTAIRSVRIVSAADGFQLLAVLPGSPSEWTLTSPGGIADTFPSLPALEAFARIVLADKPLSIAI